MRTSSTTPWQRWREEQVRSTRRLLAIGALVGLAAGLAAQLLVGDVDPQLRWLVRLALVLPAGIFLAWWLVGPGISLERDRPVDAGVEPIDVAERLRRVEAAFDDRQGAVPGVRRGSARGSSGTTAEAFARSIRRPQQDDAREQQLAPYRVRRPQPPIEPRGNAG